MNLTRLEESKILTAARLYARGCVDAGRAETMAEKDELFQSAAHEFLKSMKEMISIILDREIEERSKPNPDYVPSAGVIGDALSGRVMPWPAGLSREDWLFGCALIGIVARGGRLTEEDTIADAVKLGRMMAERGRK